jgi:hypothetical protein
LFRIITTFHAMFKRRDSTSKAPSQVDESLDGIFEKYKSEIEHLAQKFPSLKDEPILLYRFIKARPNLKQSEEMITDYLVSKIFLL